MGLSRDTVGQEKIDAATNEDYTLNLNKLAQYLGVEIPQAQIRLLML